MPENGYAFRFIAGGNKNCDGSTDFDDGSVDFVALDIAGAMEWLASEKLKGCFPKRPIHFGDSKILRGYLIVPREFFAEHRHFGRSVVEQRYGMYNLITGIGWQQPKKVKPFVFCRASTMAGVEGKYVHQYSTPENEAVAIGVLIEID